MNLPITVTDGTGARHVLERVIGRGGQGTVFATRDASLVVKLLHSHTITAKEKLRQRLSFVRSLPLDGLSLARPLEIIEPPYAGYVMEFMKDMQPIANLMHPGRHVKSVRQWFQQSGGLFRRLRLLGRAAHLLGRLHGRGLAYSDPSPANVFVSALDEGEAAGFIDTDNLRVETLPGKSNCHTPGYAAPELVLGTAGVSTLTDCFAFAVIAFRVLSLVHPFIGDEIGSGPPEFEMRAFEGAFPWIDDPENASNTSSKGIPRGMVFSRMLAGLFTRTFGPGRMNPLLRPGALAWGDALLAASDSTVECGKCSGSFYVNNKTCPWCGNACPEFAIARFELCYPEGECDGARADVKNARKIACQLVIPENRQVCLYRRHVTGVLDQAPDEALLAVQLESDNLQIKLLGERSVRVCDAKGKELAPLDKKGKKLILEHGRVSRSLRFGFPDMPHRMVSFFLNGGGSYENQ